MPGGQRRAFGPVPPSLLRALDQPVAVEHGMDSALCRDADIAGQLADQHFADLARTPVRLLAPGGDDQLLNRRRQLIGIAHRPPRPVRQRLSTLRLVAAVNLEAGLSGYPERPAHITHPLTFQQAGHKSQSFVHNRTLLPGHRHLPSVRGKVLPMCPVRSVTYVSGRSPDLAAICCANASDGAGIRSAARRAR